MKPAITSTQFLRQLIRVSILSVFALPVSDTHAQIPETFENLQLLNPELERGELVSIMRDWAGGLGVRCTHCHVDPDNLLGMDFATDEKPTKRTARRMLKMSRAINKDLLADLPTVEKGADHQVASCYTCHRGQAKPPQSIRVLVAAVAMSSGLDAAMERYRGLREEHYGLGRYDFGARSLNAMGRQLVDMGRAADASKFYRMGIEFHPESAELYAGLAMAVFQADDVEGGERSAGAGL